MNIKSKFCYDYPRPALTVDCIIFSKSLLYTKVLLIQRKNEPFKDFWAFPGGFVDMDETTFESAKRELKEETGIEINDLTQIYTFSDVNRDPRGRTVSVVYHAFVNDTILEIKAGDDAKNVKWFSLEKLPDLAFDHNMILNFVLENVSPK